MKWLLLLAVLWVDNRKWPLPHKTLLCENALLLPMWDKRNPELCTNSVLTGMDDFLLHSFPGVIF